MKSVINVESILVLMVVYFIMGDPLSLAPLFSSLIGKFFILVLLMIFSSYNLVYGLVFLVLLLHIDENRIEGLENYAMDKDYQQASSAVMKSLEVFKCNSNNESTAENWEELVVFSDGKKCDPCKPECNTWKFKEDFKLKDNNDILTNENKIRSKQSVPVVNNSSTSNVNGFNIV